MSSSLPSSSSSISSSPSKSSSPAIFTPYPFASLSFFKLIPTPPFHLPSFLSTPYSSPLISSLPSSPTVWSTFAYFQLTIQHSMFYYSQKYEQTKNDKIALYKFTIGPSSSLLPSPSLSISPSSPPLLVFSSDDIRFGDPSIPGHIKQSLLFSSLPSHVFHEDIDKEGRMGRVLNGNVGIILIDMIDNGILCYELLLPKIFCKGNFIPSETLSSPLNHQNVIPLKWTEKWLCEFERDNAIGIEGFDTKRWRRNTKMISEEKVKDALSDIEGKKSSENDPINHQHLNGKLTNHSITSSSTSLSSSSSYVPVDDHSDEWIRCSKTESMQLDKITSNALFMECCIGERIN